MFRYLTQIRSLTASLLLGVSSLIMENKALASNLLDDLYFSSQENSESLYISGKKYFKNNLSTSEDFQKALDNLEGAANLGHPHAAYKLAEIYQQGFKTIPQDREKSYQYFDMASRYGDPQASYIVKNWVEILKQLDEFKYFENDEMDVEPPLTYVYALLSKAKYEQDNTRAKFEMGKIYFEGREDIGVNPVKRLKYLKLAADQKFIPAHFMLGNIYDCGLKGISQDKEKAITHYREAAAHGYLDAREKLPQLEEEITKALNLLNNFPQLLKEPDRSDKREILYKIWKYFKEYPELAKKFTSLENARLYLIQSAEEDYIPALFELGINYLRGINDFESNEEEGLKYLTRAEAKGSKKAKNFLKKYLNSLKQNFLKRPREEGKEPEAKRLKTGNVEENKNLPEDNLELVFSLTTSSTTPLKPSQNFLGQPLALNQDTSDVQIKIAEYLKDASPDIQYIWSIYRYSRNKSYFDFEKGKKFFELIKQLELDLKLGDSEALYKKSLIYFCLAGTSSEIKKDHIIQQAIEQMNEAAHYGYQQACSWLTKLYTENIPGIDIKLDFEKAQVYNLMASNAFDTRTPVNFIDDLGTIFESSKEKDNQQINNLNFSELLSLPATHKTTNNFLTVGEILSQAVELSQGLARADEKYLLQLHQLFTTGQGFIKPHPYHALLCLNKATIFNHRQKGEDVSCLQQLLVPSLPISFEEFKDLQDKAFKDNDVDAKFNLAFLFLLGERGIPQSSLLGTL
ncbi:MAG: tetratricopeptide repeat protein [Janthinobacterium lividum]